MQIDNKVRYVPARMKASPYVLVVDDEEALREVLTRWLVAGGYDVISVQSADEAIGVMEKVVPSIVITDIAMPIHDGFWLLEQIHNRWPEAAVIMESGASNQDSIAKARRLGALEFLPKPFGRELLFQALQRTAARLAAVTTPAIQRGAA